MYKVKKSTALNAQFLKIALPITNNFEISSTKEAIEHVLKSNQKSTEKTWKSKISVLKEFYDTE